MSAAEREHLSAADRGDSDDEHEAVNETTRLLADSQDNTIEAEALESHDGDGTTSPRDPAPLIRPKDIDTRRRWRWASIISMIVLACLIIAIMILGFLVPPAVKQYAENAVVLEPTGLSIESITSDGVRARIQANFRMEGARVDNPNSRRIGRFATGIMRKLQTEETEVWVHLPNYDNALLGSAVIPSLVIDLRDGHNNAMDFVTDLAPGDAENIRKIANDWLDGKLSQLRVTGKAALKLKSGIFPLGTHDVVETMVFEATGLPSVPDYQIKSLDVHDVPVDGGDKAIGGDVTLTAFNPYPLALNLPPLGFEVLVADCDPEDPYILVAEATSKIIHIKSKANVSAEAEGIMREIPDRLTRACPSSELSPLDHFMEEYLKGEKAQVFVRGKQRKDTDTPDWIGSLMDGFTVPVDFPGTSFGDIIRNFSLADVHFKLPSPFASPGDPGEKPRVSGIVQVLAGIPQELNLDFGVDKIRADSDLFYKHRKLGELNLEHWEKANSTKLLAPGQDENLMNITAKIVDAPIDITDGDVFSDIMQKMLFGDEEIILNIKAFVDVSIATVLGGVTLRNVPAQGEIPVQGLSTPALPGKDLISFMPKVTDMSILDTYDTGFLMEASVDVTNPSPYTARIPYASVHVLHDDRLIGEVTVSNVDIGQGSNHDLVVRASWDPITLGGEKAEAAGQQLLSDYVSGKNATITLRTHRGTIPTIPLIGQALSGINMTIPAPRLRLPGQGDDDDDDGDGDGEGRDDEMSQRFIRDATFHIFTSTCSFTLASPLRHNTLYIENINATAFYNHTEPVGHIIYNEPFAATPGLSHTPRLPVDWSADHLGYEKVRKALGGSLKLDAEAEVTIRMGNWAEQIHYTGKGIGAKVRL